MIMDRTSSRRVSALWGVGLVLWSFVAFGQGEAPVVPQGIIPVPVEPGIVVSLQTDKATYAPGDALALAFTLSHDAYVYVYNLTPDGRVKLLVPNRFLQDPRFPAGRHVLPPRGWVLRVTEPEGIEFVQLLATERPLAFYEAKAFEERAFLSFANPAQFAQQLQAMLPGRWGTAWTRFRVHRPRATVAVTTSPIGAEVWVGESYVGTSPLSTVIAPGRIRVRVEKAGYETRSLDLTVGDGEEVTLAVTLSRARPPLWPPAHPAWTVDGELPSLGIGLAVGLTSLSIGADLWFEGLGFGVSVRPAPPRPDLTLPGPGGWYAWGPEVEGYLAGWLPIGRAGGLVLVGLSAQEMAWVPPWSPAGGLVPLVDIEPETETEVRLTWGAGLGVSGPGWRAYLLWHSRRNLVLGFVLTP
jgi:hypothetical protein